MSPLTPEQQRQIDENKINMERETNRLRQQLKEERQREIDREKSDMKMMEHTQKMELYASRAEDIDECWNKAKDCAQRLLEDAAGYDTPISVMNDMTKASTALAYALNRSLTKYGYDPVHLVPESLCKTVGALLKLPLQIIKSPYTAVTEGVPWLKDQMGYRTETLFLPKKLSQLVSADNGHLNFDNLHNDFDLKEDEKTGLENMIKLTLLAEGYHPRFAGNPPAMENPPVFVDENNTELTAARLTHLLDNDERLQKILKKQCNIECLQKPAPVPDAATPPSPSP